MRLILAIAFACLGFLASTEADARTRQHRNMEYACQDENGWYRCPQKYGDFSAPQPDHGPATSEHHDRRSQAWTSNGGSRRSAFPWSARGVVLQDIARRNGGWTAEEAAEAESLRSAWDWIRAVRDRSNALQAPTKTDTRSISIRVRSKDRGHGHPIRLLDGCAFGGEREAHRVRGFSRPGRGGQAGASPLPAGLQRHLAALEGEVGFVGHGKAAEAAGRAFVREAGRLKIL